jgi:hypothetical protein
MSSFGVSEIRPPAALARMAGESCILALHRLRIFAIGKDFNQALVPNLVIGALRIYIPIHRKN